MTSEIQQQNLDLYRRFLAACTVGDYDEVARVVTPSFDDHHPGSDSQGVEAFVDALRTAQGALQISSTLQEILPVGDDRVLTRLRLNGKHVGTMLDIPATGRAVDWTTTEIWRVEEDRLAERWAQYDLLGLRAQLLEEDDNLKLVRRVSDAVNARRYGDLDPLFAPSFTDHNPAWSVRDLHELKGIITATQRALDFTAVVDRLYTAAGARVVMQITFRGKHVAPIFGIKATGKAVSWTSIEVYRVEDHRIAERWVQADTTGLMRQLGVPLPD